METVKMGENVANGVRVTYFVAECMEFLRYGEYVEDILECYDKITPDRPNAGKGISFGDGEGSLQYVLGCFLLESTER